MYYEMNIAGCDRKLPLCRLNDDLMIGAFVNGLYQFETLLIPLVLERIVSFTADHFIVRPGTDIQRV